MAAAVAALMECGVCLSNFAAVPHGTEVIRWFGTTLDEREVLKARIESIISEAKDGQWTETFR
ncbi:MAG: hypothetical protein GY696_19335 [Gammaproteobacteria bacterium]|nr:hypothetical protein [Gammaproteobacteria bacterium]